MAVHSSPGNMNDGRSGQSKGTGLDVFTFAGESVIRNEPMTNKNSQLTCISIWSNGSTHALLQAHCFVVSCSLFSILGKIYFPLCYFRSADIFLSFSSFRKRERERDDTSEMNVYTVCMLETYY